MPEHVIDLTDRGILSIAELDGAVTRVAYSHPGWIYADAPVRVTEAQAEAWEQEIADRVDDGPTYLGSPPSGRPTTIYGHPLEVVPNDHWAREAVAAYCQHCKGNRCPQCNHRGWVYTEMTRAELRERLGLTGSDF